MLESTPRIHSKNLQENHSKKSCVFCSKIIKTLAYKIDECNAYKLDERKACMRRKILPVIIVILGVLFLSYPLISTIWNNYQEKVLSKAYEGHISDQADEATREQLAQADRYNQKKKNNVFIDPYQNLDEHTSAIASKDYEEYKNLLKGPDGIIALVKVPKISVSLPIYHGTSHSTLQRGAGHLYGSDLPVGGRTRHAIITAHTGLANSTMFDELTKLERGDEFYIEIQGEKLKYKVRSTAVIEPTDITKLQREENQDLVTLLTCHPYGVNSHRLIVTGERVLPNPIETPPIGYQFPLWMIFFIASIAISLIILLVIIINLAKKEKNDEEAEESDEKDSKDPAENAQALKADDEKDNGTFGLELQRK